MNMKKLISAICVSIVLSACNQQSKTAQAEEPVQSIQAADCTAPMDITVEQYLINLEQAFKTQNVSTKSIIKILSRPIVVMTLLW